MAQQTAVEWLVNKIYMVIPNEERNFLEGLREQAKAIEKEQMIHFAETMPKKKGITQEGEPYVQYDAEQYYNETYNK